MRTRNKVLITLACAVLLVVGSVFGTLAYLTDDASVTNTFTTGNVKITLDEAKVNGEGKPVDANGKVVENLANAERVVTNTYHLLPGKEYTKDPTVHVTKGSDDCYVRVFLTITQSAEWDAICDTYSIGATEMFIGYKDSVWKCENITEDENNNLRTYELWYNEKVVKNDTKDTDLPAVFTSIKMPTQLTNEDMAELEDKFAIYVVAQAIQADGFTDNNSNDSTMYEAFGEAPAITGEDLTPAAPENPSGAED